MLAGLREPEYIGRSTILMIEHHKSIMNQTHSIIQVFSQLPPGNFHSVQLYTRCTNDPDLKSFIEEGGRRSGGGVFEVEEQCIRRNAPESIGGRNAAFSRKRKTIREVLQKGFPPVRRKYI
ncbi:hypothetical protein V513_12170 [Mesotoga sp. H07.pep.5.3]|nr:hypothetical protein V513_12170 [Mesotoga sp. H07.pep.5.3]